MSRQEGLKKMSLASIVCFVTLSITMEEVNVISQLMTLAFYMVVG